MKLLQLIVHGSHVVLKDGVNIESLVGFEGKQFFETVCLIQGELFRSFLFLLILSTEGCGKNSHGQYKCGAENNVAAHLVGYKI